MKIDLALDEVRHSRLLIDRLDAWLYSEISPYMGDRVLDVGCGLGNLLRHLLDRELVIGIDLHASSVEAVKREFDACQHVKAFVQDITDDSALALAGYRFDTIVSLNVLEHIRDDASALSNMFEILSPGGILVLIVPAHRWLYGSMDSSIGHFRRYDKNRLAAKLTEVGFSVERQYYLNCLGSLGWFVNGRVLRREVPPRGQLRLFNWVVPLVQAMEHVMHPPVGLSLVSVSRRRAKRNDAGASSSEPRITQGENRCP